MIILLARFWNYWNLHIKLEQIDKNINKKNKPIDNKYNKTRFHSIIMNLKVQLGRTKIISSHEICTVWYHWMHRKKQREAMGYLTDPRKTEHQNSQQMFTRNHNWLTRTSATTGRTFIQKCLSIKILIKPKGIGIMWPLWTLEINYNMPHTKKKLLGVDSKLIRTGSQR